MPPPSPNPEAPATSAGIQHGAWAMALICVAQLMVVLDATITNIALPYLRADLDFSQANLSWVVTAYALTFGGFLLVGGRTGDLIGRRRAFTLGLVGFAAASLLGGFAVTDEMLLTSRALQGLAAAFCAPNALALIATTFAPGPARSRAFAIYAMMSGLGASLGLLLGGALTQISTIGDWSVQGWRFTFLINVPIGIAAALAAPRLLPESDRATGRLDVPGAATATLGLLSLVFGITRAGEEDHGWSDPITLGALGLGVALMATFIAVERRAREPMIPSRIVRSRDRVAAYVVMMITPAAMFTTFFFLTLVLQGPLGQSPLDTGLKFLPFSVTMIVAAIVVSRLVARVNPGILTFVGTLISGAGLMGLSRMPYSDSPATLGVGVDYSSDILPFIIMMPIGMSMTFIPMTMSVVHRISPADSGIASGILNTMQQVGGSLGLALLSTIALNAAHTKTDELLAALKLSGDCDAVPLSGAPEVVGQVCGVAFLHGGTQGFVYGACMLWAAGLVALFFNRIRHQDLQSAH